MSTSLKCIYVTWKCLYCTQKKRHAMFTSMETSPHMDLTVVCPRETSLLTNKRTLLPTIFPHEAYCILWQPIVKQLSRHFAAYWGEHMKSKKDYCLTCYDPLAISGSSKATISSLIVGLLHKSEVDISLRQFFMFYLCKKNCHGKIMELSYICTFQTLWVFNM